MKLLIDLGNTRLKWGIGRGRNIDTKPPLVHNNSFIQDSLIDLWGSMCRPEQIAISNVSSSQLVDQIKTVVQQLWPGHEIISPKSLAQGFGVQNSYQQPQTLGVDRWLCLLALRHYYTLPACVVDCGTAITVDVLDAHGQHLGGMISPGLGLMKTSLAQGTTQLGSLGSVYPAGLAASTEAAIHTGTLFSAAGLIEFFLARHFEGLSLVMTGGDAQLIAAQLAHKSLIEPDLVLQGLSVVLENGL
jgi:type III pantothenate kinase